LWSTFSALDTIREIDILNIANKLWEDRAPHHTYTTLRGTIPGTHIAATFDISSYDVIVEVADRDYNAALAVVHEVYGNIPDLTITTVL
jgi:hypothetical protein